MSAEATLTEEVEDDEIDQQENDPPITVEEAIRKFKEVLLAVSGINNLMAVNFLKFIAGHFRMTKNLSKSELTTLIANKFKNQEAVKNIMEAENQQISQFRRNKNTVRRILNILTRYPDGMLRSRARASRQDLENGNTRANSDFWMLLMSLMLEHLTVVA
jgi:F0F1-type ATP synthase alpha subunit